MSTHLSSLRVRLLGSLAALSLLAAAVAAYPPIAAADAPGEPPRNEPAGECLGRLTASNARHFGVTPQDMAEFHGVTAGEFQMFAMGEICN